MTPCLDPTTIFGNSNLSSGMKLVVFKQVLAQDANKEVIVGPLADGTNTGSTDKMHLCISKITIGSRNGGETEAAAGVNSEAVNSP